MGCSADARDMTAKKENGKHEGKIHIRNCLHTNHKHSSIRLVVMLEPVEDYDVAFELGIVMGDTMRPLTVPKGRQAPSES